MTCHIGVKGLLAGVANVGFYWKKSILDNIETEWLAYFTYPLYHNSLQINFQN